MIMITLVDAHCHLSDIKDYKPTGRVLPVTCGYSHASNIKTVEIAKKLNLPFSLGIAPQSAIGNTDLSHLEEWVEFIRKSRPNAIGEIGLDYHWAKCEEDVKREEEVFARMLDLAEEMGLPIVIHSRKAMRDVIDTLKMRKTCPPFMMHFFSGTPSEARWVVERGGLISIPPLHSKERRIVIEETPLENIVVETDSPYIVRTPEQVDESVEYVAEVKNIDFDVAAEQTARNAHRFFNF